MKLKERFRIKSKTLESIILILCSLLYLICAGYLIKNYGLHIFLALPIVLMVIVVAFFRIDILLLITVFLIPLSVPLSDFIDVSVDASIPSELLIMGILLLMIIKLLLQHNSQLKRIYRHPVSVAIFIYLGWILITSFSSTMPLVSFKQFLAKLWFLAAFYFLVLYINKQRISYPFVFAYSIGLAVVVAYTIKRHLSFGLFDELAAHHVMTPFYPDHTSYGAIMALLIPVHLGFVFNKDLSRFARLAALAFAAIFGIALVLSFTRAAWLSLVMAFGVFVLVLFRIKFRTVVLVSVTIAGYVILNFTNIVHSFEKNDQGSKSTNFSKHAQSITNITTDDSNVERINRWNCAITMYKEKPFFGWGPGTYMFQYAPYQLSKYQTLISTNMGDVGNAHSEYLGPLSESGAIGMLSFIAIVVLTTITAFRVYRNEKNMANKIFVLSLILGLITYYLHGAFNNFLDTDKLASVFWGFTAMIVMMDLNQRKSTETERLKG